VLPNLLENSAINRAYYRTIFAAVICFIGAFVAQRLHAQNPSSLRLSWRQRANDFQLYDLYEQELAQFYAHQPFIYLSEDGQVVEAPKPDQTPEDQEFETLDEELTSAPPGAMAFGGFRHWLQNTPFFGNGVDDIRDPRRHWGVGVPLEGTSWRNRPWHAGFLIGMLDGGEVANGTVLQDSGMLLGIHIGNDFDHYWGWEFRAATAQVDLNRLDTGAPLAQDGRNTYYDLNLLYYPLGDTRWRPYFLVGIGASTHGFADIEGNSYDETTATMPIGLGMKYFVRPGTSIRADFINNISFGTENAAGSDNISLSIGLDWHFGGSRKVYYPWDSSLMVW
jgi:hypothetical protein